MRRTLCAPTKYPLNEWMMLQTGLRRVYFLIITITNPFRRVYCVAGVILSVLKTSVVLCTDPHGLSSGLVTKHRSLKSSFPKLLATTGNLGITPRQSGWALNHFLYTRTKKVYFLNTRTKKVFRYIDVTASNWEK